MTVIITKNGKGAQKIDPTNFVDEKELQAYLYENPDIVPVYEIDEAIKLLILSREFQTNSGPIDALGVDKNGDLYIVETKLYKNPDKRTVIAQAIDYGASMWAYYKDFTDFVTRLDSDVNKKFGVSLNQKLSDFFEIELEEVDIILDTMKENINRGIFKFVVLMDQLETRLKDLIRFINQNSQFDVYAVELEYYKFNDHELMIPKIYGAEVKKDLSVSSSSSTSVRKSWDEASYFKELKTSVDSDTYSLIKDFYEFSVSNFDMLSWGSGKKGAFSIGDSKLFPKSIYTVKSDGTLVINLGWHSESSEKVEKVATLLRSTGFDLEGPPYKQHYFYSFDEWSEKIEDIKKALQDLI